MTSKKGRGRKKRRCVCGAEFVPNPRLKERQKTCGSEECKRRQNLLAQKFWKKKESIVYRQGQIDWRNGCEDGYFKLWRADHPEYVVRNRIFTRVRKSLLKRKVGLQRKLDILQLFEKQVKFRRYCGLQRKLVRLFDRSRITSRFYERTQSYQERAGP